MPVLILDIEATGTDPFADGVVAIGYRIRDKEKTLTGEEQSTLRQLSKVMESADRVVGYGIGDFDLPFIKIRCMKHGTGIRIPDMVDLSKIHPHRKRLEDWCRFMGIKRDYGLDGSQVPGLFREGKMDLITRHCLDDVRAIGIIWKRLNGTVEPR